MPGFDEVTGPVLLLLAIVFAGGLFAGMSKKGRFGLLGAGLVLVLVVTLLMARVWTLDLTAPRAAVAAQLAGMYAVVLPPVVAFVTGWLVARGRWLWRGLVVVAAVLVLAFVSYAALGDATAGVLLTSAQAG